MIEWPENIKRRFITLGFEGCGKSLYIRQQAGLAYLVSLEGGGNDLIRMYAAVCLSEQVKAVTSSRGNLHQLPLGGGVSMNAVGSGGGDFYWVEEEVLQNPSTFEGQLNHCIEDIMLPWFCAFPDRSEVLKVLEHEEVVVSGKERHSSTQDISAVPTPTVQGGSLCSRDYARYSQQDFLRENLEVLSSALGDLGFQPNICDGIRYFRWREQANLVDVIYLRLIGFGSRLISEVFIWVPEFIGEKSFNSLPEDLMIVNGGVLAGDHIEFYPYLRTTCSQAFDEYWFDELQHRLREVAVPWFDSIRDRADLISHVRRDMKPVLDDPIVEDVSLRKMILSDSPGTVYQ